MDLKTPAGDANRLAPIARISPSRAVSLMRCGLAEAFRTAKYGLRLPLHPKAHFGILAHDFIHKAASGQLACDEKKTVAAAWRENAAEYEKRISLDPIEQAVVPLRSTCDDYEVNSLLCIKEASSVLKSPAGGPAINQPSSQRERTLESKDHFVVGRLDVIEWVGGEAVVTDFKTGRLLLPEGEASEAYAVQLKLYAYLCHEMTGKWPKRLKLQDLRGKTLEIAFEQAEVAALVQKLKERVRQIDSAIKEITDGKMMEEAIASPNPATCRFCRYRIVCDAYWKQRHLEPDKKWAPDLSGKIAALKPLGNEHVIVEIENAEGVFAVRGARRSLLDIKSRNAPAVGLSVRLCELKPERAPRTFSSRPYSAILVC